MRSQSYPLLLALAVRSLLQLVKRSERGSEGINDHTQSSLSITPYHHRSFVDISNFYRRLLDKDQNIRCMLCCNADARSAFWSMVMAKKGENRVPAELFTTLLPSLLVLVFMSHCDLRLRNMFRMMESMVCCHEGRESKVEEVCAFRQILPFCDF